MSSPRFFSAPLSYMRWASIEKPAIFYSIVVGCIGPVMMVVVPPLRHRFGDGPREAIPLSYPSEYFSLQLWRNWVQDVERGEQTMIHYCVALTVAICAVPKGPRKIPEGYDD
ncbi:hypothetical protein B0A49_06149 [Cryomyces minteri]|uniref:NADH-ubiquinone oxidoreductase 9.5 kDa subunit n=1 Tax=Cryomyces minteri TaxID=331657 RepID=A0A4U0X9F9_9PEZI|nr:hypothetical protein B0A49_06149 [Cryomyces minteri]